MLAKDMSSFWKTLLKVGPGDLEVNVSCLLSLARISVGLRAIYRTFIPFCGN